MTLASPSASSLLDQAIAAHRRGERDLAEGHYRAFLAQQPLHPDALALLGTLLGEKGNYEEAIALVGQAIAADPDAALFRFHLGNLYRRSGKLDEAIRELKKSVELEPRNGEGWLNLCRAAEQAYDFELSLEAGKKAVELMPESFSAHFSTGVALTRLERHEEAESFYKTTLTLRPDWTEAWDNLGLTYQFLNRLDEAEAAFRKVIDLAGQSIPDDQVRLIDERDFGIRHWHLAQLELMRGEYERGFGRYRCRFSGQGGLKRMDWPQPYWRGEDIRGKTLLVMDEEGRGDGLMMCRYLPLLRAQGVRAKFYIRPVFASLFKGWDGADEVIVHGEPIGNFDVYTWVFDLPFCFGTTLATVPSQTPYLPLLSPDAKTQLGPRSGKRRVGVVWAGSATQVYDKRRVPLELFGKLFDISGIEFYNLTRDKRPGDDALLAHLPVTDLAPCLGDFGDLARFMMQMDLIVSCDTAAPQLAGGMGKEVWTLLAFSSDWRWLTERKDSPWYPSMRLFRQRRTGDWEGVIEQVRAALIAEKF